MPRRHGCWGRRRTARERSRGSTGSSSTRTCPRATRTSAAHPVACSTKRCRRLRGWPDRKGLPLVLAVDRPLPAGDEDAHTQVQLAVAVELDHLELGHRLLALEEGLL